MTVEFAIVDFFSQLLLKCLSDYALDIEQRDVCFFERFLRLIVVENAFDIIIKVDLTKRFIGGLEGGYNTTSILAGNFLFMRRLGRHRQGILAFI